MKETMNEPGKRKLSTELEALRQENARLKSADMALRETEERFRIMCDTAPVMVWMSGTDKLCTFFNRPWLAFTGRSMEQEMGNGWADGVHPEDQDRCLADYISAFDARQPFCIEYRLRRFDGQYRWILDNGVPRYNGDGNFAGYIGSGIDITDHKTTEAALLQRQREIEALNIHLRRAIEETHHRVTNNLQAVTTLLEMRLEGAQRDFPVRGVRESLLQLRTIALVHDLLANKQPFEQIDAKLMLSNLAPLLHQNLCLSEEEVRVQLDVEAVPLTARTATALALITNELISNAVKHGKPAEDGADDAAITIRLSRQTSDIMIEVEDRGPGFPQGFDISIHAKLGLDLVSSLVEHDLQGRISIVTVGDEANARRTGGKVTIRFPEASF